MNDYIVRATAANHQIRAFACTTKEAVEMAKNIHNTSPVATAALGRLLTAGSMMGSMLKGEKDLITLQIKGSGPIQGLVVTADANANVKGYVFNPDVMLPPNALGKLDVAEALGLGVLSIIKDIGLKEPYIGQTHLVTSEIAEDLTYYYATSEQTPSVVALGVLMNKDNTVRQSGGFIIQLLPDASEEVISHLEEKIKQVTSVTEMFEEGNSPEQILEIILGDLGLQILEKVPTKYHCNCHREKVEKALISVGRKDLQEMIDEGKPVELNCHFCNEKYEFQVTELEGYLKN
ncbi:molecular chaperone Hsp33 [Natranaerovirga pectinivora]|uniref:33 kDa chaperonin n=1 Tax=Natranaerovirga pectinivora TaxID=682400 RepID=A0A4R3MLB2_9FIRM|nr:Hsp33 family molecular chaperone HslO [Natranaerovirga pectinivora]TCT14342.1 molecular chaperone Hsp33 [Natranaerovirga pectinivora]